MDVCVCVIVHVWVREIVFVCIYVHTYVVTCLWSCECVFMHACTCPCNTEQHWRQKTAHILTIANCFMWCCNFHTVGLTLIGLQVWTTMPWCEHWRQLWCSLASNRRMWWWEFPPVLSLVMSDWNHCWFLGRICLTWPLCANSTFCVIDGHHGLEQSNVLKIRKSNIRWFLFKLVEKSFWRYLEQTFCP